MIKKDQTFAFFIILLGVILALNLYIKDNNKSILCEQDEYSGFVLWYDGEKATVKVNGEKIYLYTDYLLKPGDEIIFKGQLNEIEYSKDDVTFNYRDYLKRKGIYNILFPTDIFVLKHSFHINTIRYLIKSYLNNLEDDTTKNYLTPLIISDKSEMDMDFKSAISTLGISHLFAISGLHIGLIVMFLKKIINYFLISEKKESIIIVTFLMVYLFITGFSPSIIRSSLVYMIYVICKYKKISFSSLDILSLSFIILALINSNYLYDLGFALSYIVSFSLILSKNEIKGNKFKKLFMISIISQVVTIPFIININGEINMLSFIPNILLVTLFSSIILPLTFLTALFPFLIYIYKYIIISFDFVINFLNMFKLMINIPYMNLEAGLIYYVLLIILMISYDKRDKWVRKAVFLLLYLFLFVNQSYLFISDRLYMFDVGQGDSSLIRLGLNRGNIIIDAYQDTWSKAKKRGVNRVDYLIITHGHSDHISGAKDVIDSLKVLNIVVSYYDDTELTKELLSYAKEKNVNIIKRKSGESITISNFKIDFLSPIYNDDNVNNLSLVMKFKLNERRFLYLGDLESDKEDELIKKEGLNLECDYMKIGHHGSNTSTSDELLEYAMPEYALISAGRNNEYGFPHDDVIEKLKKRDIKILETKDGTFYFDKKGILEKVLHIIFL